MAALDFPSSPVNGQTYSLNGVTYYYDATVNAWLTDVVDSPIIKAYVNVGNTAPVNANTGDMWFNSDLSKFFVYYNDGDSSQWIEPSYSSIFNVDQYGLVNTAFTVANSGFTVANSGFGLANTVNTFAYGVATNTTAAFGFANGVSTNTTAAFAKANTALANGSVVINGTVRPVALNETQTAPTISAGTLTLDCSTGNIFKVALNANITTLTFSNVPAANSGYGMLLSFTADGSARTVTWPAAVKWPQGTAPTLTSTNGKVDTFVLTTWDNGTNWYAFTGGQNA